jgi:hypothetical protein
MSPEISIPGIPILSDQCSSSIMIDYSHCIRPLKEGCCDSLNGKKAGRWVIQARSCCLSVTYLVEAMLLALLCITKFQSSRTFICALAVVALVGPVSAGLTTEESTGVCQFLAATNMEQVFSEWQCSGSMLPVTDPCNSAWHGVLCNQGTLTNLVFTDFSVEGWFTCDFLTVFQGFAHSL